jgi:hypothetical protein
MCTTVFAAVAGAQFLARSPSDLSVFDSLIESYRALEWLPMSAVNDKYPASSRDNHSPHD